MRRWFWIIIICLLTTRLAAQDGLDLPAPLYVLTNNGQVQRIGLGAEGLSRISPEEAFVVDFGVAPDDNWLAYRTEQGLTIRNIFTDEQVTLEEGTADLPPSRGRGDTLAWSPAGDMLVYTTAYGGRVYHNTAPEPVISDLREGPFVGVQWSPDGTFLAAEAEDNIWWLYRREGSLLILTSAIPSSLGLAWVSNSEVVFAPGDGGLIRMNLANANAQTVLLDNTWNYRLPALQTDGTLVVFGARKDDEAVPEGSALLVALAADAARSGLLNETPLEVNGLRWGPGGQLAVALRGGVLALVQPAGSLLFPLPFADVVAYSWGSRPLARVDGLPLTANSYLLAADGNDVNQVWRLPQAGTTPVQLTQLEKAVTAYAASPDEGSLAYVSDDRLWLVPLTEGGAARILTETTTRSTDLTFSPDGKQIAYVAADGEQGGIWLVSVAGGDAKLIRPNAASDSAPAPEGAVYTNPNFAPNINGLLVTRSAPSAPDALILIDLNTLDIQEVGVASRAVWLQNGSILAYNSGIGYAGPSQEQIIYRIDPADPASAKLATIPRPARIIAMRDVLAVRARLALGSVLPGPRALNVVDMLATTGAISSAGRGGFMVNPAFSPDGRFLAGQTHEGGALTIRDLDSGQQVVLNIPPQMSDFSWAR
jgi:WD40 repeat protein